MSKIVRNETYQQKSSRRIRLVVVAITWIVLLIVAFVGIGGLYIAATGSGKSVISLDWGGYAVVSDNINPQPVAVGINGSWTVPQVQVSTQTDTFSAAWIGIGGEVGSDQTLIQTGTEHDSIGGQVSYSAWYELLPNDSVTISTLNISPGDQITASIELVDDISNNWSIAIQDVTTGKGFQEYFIYGSSRLSAEWIVERPTIGSSLSALANFGTVTFTGAQAQIDTNNGRISAFPYLRVTMVDRQNIQLVQVSPISHDGTSFTVSYG